MHPIGGLWPSRTLAPHQRRALLYKIGLRSANKPGGTTSVPHNTLEATNPGQSKNLLMIVIKRQDTHEQEPTQEELAMWEHMCSLPCTTTRRCRSFIPQLSIYEASLE
jgi:hypothetical protein